MQEEDADLLAVGADGNILGIDRFVHGHADVPLHLGNLEANDVLDIAVGSV